MLRMVLRGLPFTLVFALLLAPSVGRAESPAEQLAALAKHIDAALTRLDAGDVAGARTEYQAFDDGWFEVEDGIREQSRASYRAIEGAMSDAKSALRAEPVDAAKARAALVRLREQCDAFIGGRAPDDQPASTEGRVTLAAEVAHLDQALARLQASDPAGAAAAVAAFRHGWTEVEGQVKAKSARLYTETENNLAKAAAQLAQRPPDLVGARETIARMKADLVSLTTGETRYGVFDAAIILFREGFEALLVVGALLAFLAKTGNADKGRWIWAGSGAGVAASVAVACVVNLLFARAAGANAELLEGTTSLVAAALLVSVSYWLHSKASLSAWQRYIRDRTSTALARNGLLSLALIAFLAVFREGAETVLFYVGIAPSIALGDLVLGLGIGAASLAVIGVLTLVFGIRLSIRPFFLLSSVLLYYLAFKFIGTGVHALQVAGVLGATPASFLPSNDVLGLFPTWETTLVQATLVFAAVVVLLAGRFADVTATDPP